MIELKATGKCKGCPEVSPTVVKLYAAGGLPIDTAVNCKNQALCNNIEKHLLKVFDKVNGIFPGDS